MADDKYTRIRESLDAYQRWAFQDKLAKLLAVEYDPEALAVYANRYPDKHAQAVVQYARLAGFSEAPVINVSIVSKVQSLGQVELAKALRETLERIRELELRSIPALTQCDLPTDSCDPS